MSEASLSEKANSLREKSDNNLKIKEIVTTLCEFIQSESAPDKNGHMVKYQVQRCPKGTLCSINASRERGVIKFRDKAAFTNPLNHIKKCCFSYDKSLLIDAYWEAKVGIKIQSNLGAFFGLPTKSPGAIIIRTKKDNELFDWVEMIVIKNWGACCVEDSVYQSKMKHEYRFSIKTVHAVIIAMTCAVEVKLAAEMKAARKGLIVHDAWTKFGTHFFGLCSTYMASHQYLVEGSMLTIYKPIISLLSVLQFRPCTQLPVKAKMKMTLKILKIWRRLQILQHKKLTNSTLKIFSLTTTTWTQQSGSPIKLQILLVSTSNMLN
jgi:hypothetical protein